MKKIEIKKEYNIHLEMAHKYSSNHRQSLEKDNICGCFQCLKLFHPIEIQSWIPDRYDDTAICPYCDLDSVIGESSGYPITEEFLQQMQEYWFKCGTWLLPDEEEDD